MSPPRIVDASLIHLLFPIRLQLQACIRSLAIPLRRPGAAITSHPNRFHPSSSWPAAIPQVPHHIHHPKSNLPCNPCNKGAPSSDYGWLINKEKPSTSQAAILLWGPNVAPHMHQKYSNYALINLLFDLCRSVWIINPLITCLNPHSGTLTCRSTPKMLWTSEHILIFFYSIFFTFEFAFEPYEKIWWCITCFPTNSMVFKMQLNLSIYTTP
jgi:hypothetical protein